MQKADWALYQAKATGRSNVIHYEAHKREELLTGVNRHQRRGIHEIYMYSQRCRLSGRCGGCNARALACCGEFGLARSWPGPSTATHRA